ncbi:respiratory nitrate reductase subunit gamma [Enterobacter hormaechei]|uniref:respiratory nitrate reductase subunit gamma n=1 Tax=Enterobacter hormaechei TaxID=158836 RepID=UPI003CC693D8
MVLGMTIFLIFPFTRLLHVWSAPLICRVAATPYPTYAHTPVGPVRSSRHRAISLPADAYQTPPSRPSARPG